MPYQPRNWTQHRELPYPLTFEPNQEQNVKTDRQILGNHTDTTASNPNDTIQVPKSLGTLKEKVTDFMEELALSNNPRWKEVGLRSRIISHTNQ